MNKKGFILLVGVVIVIFLLFAGGDDTPKDSDRIIGDANLTAEKIKIAHVFMDGIHTFTGEINLPTPCHTLTHKVIIAESYPEQVAIVFERKSDVDVCAQIITPEPFTITFMASREATFKIVLDGEEISFEVIEAESAEDAEGGDSIVSDSEGKTDKESIIKEDGDETILDVTAEESGDNVSLETN